MDIDTTPQVQDNTNVGGAPAPVNTTSGQVFVKTLTGQSIPIDYRADLTVAELKNEVSSREGVPVQQDVQADREGKEGRRTYRTSRWILLKAFD